ncbi:hypothetical protein F5883DRAFT_15667 [Diaporthe sp. PMI_573]|nr:hypothetical protein F5883DRAFT_15667 [Diaporthaceae sp. PMI_573]
MTRHLNRIKGRDFRRFTRGHTHLHGNQFNNNATVLPSPFPVPPPPAPPPHIPMSFHPPHPPSHPPPPPPRFGRRYSGSHDARLPSLDGAANLNIRGGSGPPSPIRETGPSKRPQKRLLSFFSGSKPSKTSKKKSKRFFPFESILGPRFENPRALLIRGYGVADKDGQIPFQPRRTLDQYFYSHLDNTARRDQDQVVFRYTRNQGAKIFMVDQMWLWIINGDTLITCIPDRWQDGNPNSHPGLTAAIAEEDLVRGPSIEHQGSLGILIYGTDPFMAHAQQELNLASEISEHNPHHDVGPSDEKDVSSAPRPFQVSPPQTSRKEPAAKPHRADDPMNVQHRVLRHLREISRDPIESIYDLAGLIATCCASAFEENQIPDDMQFFDFFERSIGSVIDKTIQSLHEFKTGLRSGYTHHSEHIRSHEKGSLGDESADEDLNIATEIDLLVEIEDIQDELHILRVVLRDQKRALRQLDDILVQGRKKHGHAHNEDAAKSMVDARCIENHMARIAEMEKLAEKAHESIYHLIDLKQKQANFSEAISARKLARETAKNTELQIKQSEELSKQAEETARQGKTLMVFTVVTIIFLPLSFMAAFFAINIDVFPVNEDGKLALDHVLKYMLSISLALAIPFVLLALRINDVKQVGQSAYRGLQRALVSPHLLPVVGYVTLALLGVVVPSVVWTSKLATTAKVAVTVLLGVTVLLVALGLAIKRITYVAARPMTMTDSSSYFSDSVGRSGS